MRIIGGEARGRRLDAPRGLDTRPTADRVRQSLFDVLGQRCDDLVVLDLYAGTGALGLEAVSRGASRCVFVEASREALAVLRRNVERLGFEDRAVTEAGDALRLERWAALGPFDLVFADPPYDKGATPILAKVSELAPVLLEPAARLVLEHDRREELPSRIGPLISLDQRRFGNTIISLFKYGDKHR